MKINELELKSYETITIVVDKDDYEHFKETTDDIIESNEPEIDGHFRTDEFLNELFDILGVDVRPKGAE